ncbi:MAG: hypothetical protein ABSD76_11830 [Terriglobales bacterium]|jgi:hypothetical protein
MKILALALVLSLPVPRVAPPAQLSPVASQQPAKRKGGQWYFAATGHAVYCYGPVVIMPQAQGGLQRVATFCRGDQTMVPLKD